MKVKLTSLIKAIKGLGSLIEEVGRDLRDQTFEIERRGLKVKFNGLGEIIDIDLFDEDLIRDWQRFKETLKDVVNEAQDISRDKMKEAILRKIGGSDIGL